MNWDRVEGNWKQFKGQVQQKWGKLTDDDLDVIEGKRTELAGRLQQRYGLAKDEAEKNIDSWLNTVNLPDRTGRPRKVAAGLRSFATTRDNTRCQLRRWTVSPISNGCCTK